MPAPLTTEKFKERSTAMHKGRYDYSKSVLTRVLEPITIICPVHGEFEQIANSHMRGAGCKRCAPNRSLTTEDWVADLAVPVHGDCYDYSLLDYQGANQPMTIICREHGAFEQTPVSHLSGKGCPACRSSHGEQEVASVLKRLGVKHIQQWRDHDCIEKRALPFDFYLPEHQALIEFDGQQHFKPVRWSYSMSWEEAEAVFAGIQRRDQLKNEWAEANGYPLLRVSDLTTTAEEVLNFVAGLEEADQKDRVLSAV